MARPKTSRMAWRLAVVFGIAWIVVRHTIALAHSPRRAFVLAGHHEAINCLAFSPDGRTLASGSDDHSLRIWNPLTGRLLHTLDLHAPVTSVAFSPDGRTLAVGRASPGRLDMKSGGVDTTIKRWDTTRWQPLRTLPQHWMGVSSLAFSPDSKLLATGNADHTVRVWDLSSNVARRTFKIGCRVVRFTPDGRRLVVGARGGVLVIDLQTGRESDGNRVDRDEIFDLKGFAPRLTSVAVSPDGKLLATGGSDRITGLWNVVTGTRLPQLKGRADAVYSVAFSPDSGVLARGSWDGSVMLWSVPSGHWISTFQAVGPPHLWPPFDGGETPVQAMTFSPDGKILATGGDDRVVTLWTMPSVDRRRSRLLDRQLRLPPHKAESD